MFQARFEELNQSLRQALYDGDFDRACGIDAQRRDLIETLMAQPQEAYTVEMLQYLEACAIENATLCAQLETSLGDLSRRSSQSQKMMRAYGRDD